MGSTILLLTIIFEAAFAAYCILTKSNQEKVRSAIRICAFATFVLFLLISVVEWSFRWYFFVLLLFIWGVLGAWTLVRRKDKKKEYNGGRMVIKAIAMLLLVFLAVVPALVFLRISCPK